MRTWTGVTALLLALPVNGVAEAQRVRPPREAVSTNGEFQLRLDAGREGTYGRACRAMLLQTREGSRQGRRVWERELVNVVSPQHVYVRDDGRCIVTLDDYGAGGARHTIVIYGPRGTLLRHFLLADVLSEGDWKHVRKEGDGLRWLDGAACGFVDDGRVFEIRLKWGRTIRIELETLSLAHRPSGGVPVEAGTAVHAQAWGDEGGGDGVIGERLADLAPPALEDLAAVQQALSPDVQETAELDPAMLAEASAESEETETQDVDDTVGADTSTLESKPLAQADTVVAESGSAVEPQEAELPLVTYHHGVALPWPNPVERVDYVSWMNELGQVAGPDAAPLYNAAIAAYQDYKGAPELYERAVREDEALFLPEMQSFLDANTAALEMFRAGAQLPARSWQRQSADGMLISVLLPELAPMRQLARLSVFESRRLAAEGRPGEAAELLIDTAAAGGHLRGGATLIEDLVGLAMQSLAHGSILDLYEHTGDTFDYTAVAERLVSTAERAGQGQLALLGERAFFRDTIQRVWKYDAGRDAFIPDYQVIDAIVPLVDDDTALSTRSALLEEMLPEEYEAMVREAESFYEALESGLAQSFPVGSELIAEVEARTQTSTNPMLRVLIPAIGRVHAIRTRSEATTRATVLIAQVQAYRQRYGVYPDSLETLEVGRFAVDPFTEQPFRYRLTENGFELYALGESGVDRGGEHDPSGKGNLRFWPRPSPQP